MVHVAVHHIHVVHKGETYTIQHHADSMTLKTLKEIVKALEMEHKKWR